MKKILFLLTAGLLTGSVMAQTLPQPSPAASVGQTVGLTEVNIKYSRPAAKGRTIFGDLVPYGEVWRTGANAPTMFTTSTDIMFTGKKLPAGTYALFTKPEENRTWTVVFNTDTEQWGAGNYSSAKDVVTLTTKAKQAAFTESFTIWVSDVTNNSAVLNLAWETVQISLPFTVDTKSVAQKNIDEAIKKGEELENVYLTAASYYSKTLNDNELALNYVEKGLKVKETYRLYFLKAQIMEQKGQKKDAIMLAEKAHKMALAAEEQGWADYIKGNMEKWQK